MSRPRKNATRATPRWMVTFADMMSLLLCLFVMLLSFSEVDSISFKKNAGPISDAFGLTKTTPKTPSPAEAAQPVFYR